MRLWLSLALIVLALGASRALADQEPVPDERQVRLSIDGLIGGFQAAKKPATVGLIQEAAMRSIAFGAPAWNNGDHKACLRFYRKTIESLCAAFGADKPATPAARALLKAMGDELERVAPSADTDRSAWGLRSTFDAADLESSVVSVRISGQVNLGTASVMHDNFPEAVASFQDACAGLDELAGMSHPSIARICRFAPLGLGNALFAEGKYKEASEAILKGLAEMPHWPISNFDPRGPQAPGSKFDPRALFGNPAAFLVAMRDLETKARAHPDDASLQFLLGYQYFFTDKHDQAIELFNKTLKLDPNHAGARLFLSTPQEEKPHPSRRAPQAPSV